MAIQVFCVKYKYNVFIKLFSNDKQKIIDGYS